MAQELQTYGDWAALIGTADRVDDALTETLCAGRFEPGAAPRVLALIQKLCERSTARAARVLSRQLSGVDGADAADVVLPCAWFVRDCARLLFFEDVAGLDTEDARELARGLRAYVSGVLGKVERTCRLQGAEDASLAVRRLERHWSRT